MICEYTIQVPKQGRWEAECASALIEQLLYAYGKLVFRIKATHQQIAWQVIDLSQSDPQGIMNAIQATYPQAQVQVQELSPYRGAPTVERIVVSYQNAVPEFVAPIKHAGDLDAANDPLAAIVQTMSGLLPGEQILYTVFIAGRASDAYNEGERLITRKVYDISLLGLLFPQTVDRYIPEQQRVFRDKLERALYQSYLKIQIDTPFFERKEALLTFDNHTVHFDEPHFNGIRWHSNNGNPTWFTVSDDETDLRTSALGEYLAYGSPKEQTKAVIQQRKETRMILEPRELAALFHLPHQGFHAPRIRWVNSAQVELPEPMRDQWEGVCIGVNHYAGMQQPVFIPLQDLLTHSLIVGKTGMGKSNLMHYAIHQHILQGHGLMVVDPHGDLVQRILACSIPPTREKDVVLLDLANEAYPIPLNPLRGIRDDVAMGRVISILYQFYEDLAEMTQTSDALENALLSLQNEPDATLRDVNRLFLEEPYRYEVLSRVQDEVALEFWQKDFGSLSLQQQRQVSAPVIRRIRAFYRNPVLRAMMCHPDGLDIASLIRGRKIVLVSLKANGERIPEREQFFIGALLIARLQLAIMNGAAHHAPFYCYVDEMQRFVSSTMDTVFSEARKFNLSLTVAHQYLKQLEGATLNAIMGNIGTLISFQVADDDARQLAHYTQPNFSAEDLVNLGKYQAAVWTRYRGEQQPAFSLSTLKPLPEMADAAARIERIRKLSIRQYTPKSQPEVLAWLKQRYGLDVPPQGSDGKEQFYD